MYERLFKLFEEDIICVYHSVEVLVNQSIAGRNIVNHGPKIFAKLVDYFKNHDSKTEADKERICHAWCVLLNNICRVYSLDNRDIRQNDFDSWVEWIERQSIVD